MNPNLCRVALRPRNPLEVFDLCMVFVRASLGPMLRLAAVGVGIPWVLLSVAAVLSQGAWWVVLLPLPLFPLLQMPFTLLGGRLLFREEATARQALAESVRGLGRLGVVAGAGLVGGLLSLFTCGYGYIPVFAGLLYLPETALLERVGPRRALRRALRLAGGNVGIALVGSTARLFLTVWMALVCEGFGQALLDTTLQLGQPVGSLWTGQITPFLLLGILLAQPIHAIYRLLLYVDVRTRIEGWDLQVGMRAAGIARQDSR